MFEGINISGSGMNAHQQWMNAISDNIANVNTVRPANEEAFRSRYMNVKAIENGGTGGGVSVESVRFSKGAEKLAYAPDNPNADENGNIHLPDVDITEQLTSMISAQRGYQANISAFDRAKASYQAAIQMGRS